MSVSLLSSLYLRPPNFLQLTKKCKVNKKHHPDWWLAILDRLNTKSRISRRTSAIPLHRNFRGLPRKSRDHLFFSSVHTGATWSPALARDSNISAIGRHGLRGELGRLTHEGEKQPRRGVSAKLFTPFIYVIRWARSHKSFRVSSRFDGELYHSA